MKRLLITGANGFVGSHLIELLEKKYEIMGLAGTDKDLPHANHVNWRVGDIADQEFVGKAVGQFKPDAVIHLAAKTQAWFSDVRHIYEVNVFGTINLYESLLNVRKILPSYNPRIIYVSSSEVYGNTPFEGLINEDAPMYPVNPYGASKASADRLSYSYTQSQKLDIVIARPFTHTGPNQQKGFFVPDMVSQIVAAERSKDTQQTIKVGNLEAIRDYLDVKDVVRAYELLFTTKELAAGEAYNICSGVGIKMADILKELFALSTKKLKTEMDPARIRPSDVPIFIGDSSKLQKATGWKPQIALKDTLQSSLDSWRTIVD